jgi:hypothetical protein
MVREIDKVIAVAAPPFRRRPRSAARQSSTAV